MMNSELNKSEQELMDGLNLYLSRGYIEKNSFESPEDEARHYLLKLNYFSNDKTIIYSKRILEISMTDNGYLKSICLYFVLLSDKPEDYMYGFNYLEINSATLSTDELQQAFEFFVLGKDDPVLKFVPEGLFLKLKKRYFEIKDEYQSQYNEIHETYRKFSRIYFNS